MSSGPKNFIPNRAETLKVLRLMGTHRPLLMLTGADDGYGTRWTLDGQQVQPAIAQYLMAEGFLVETGRTEFGARQLNLSAKGNEFRDKGFAWWSSLGWLQRIKVMILG
jgi:hypothetical protein